MNNLISAYRESMRRVDEYEVVVKENDTTSTHTLVLVHGIGVSSEYFHPLMNELSQKIHVVALDLPGYGKASKPEEELGIEALATVLNRYVEESGLESCVLVGHSMGTQIVVEAAKQKPGKYTACILMGPTINKHERTLLQQAWRLLQDMTREPLANNLVVMRDYMRMGPIRYIKTSVSMLSDALEKEVARLAIPILILTGERDPIATREWARLLREASKRDSHVEIAGAAHNFHFSHPKETAKVCLDFLDV